MTNYDLAREYVNKYLELNSQNGHQYSKRFIATVMHEENPGKFSSIEMARGAVRGVTGCHGKTRAKGKEELNKAFALMESPVIELMNPEPFIIPKQYKKALFIADLHSLFCDQKALKIAIEYGIERKCDCVIILGDLCDYYQHSRFSKNPDIVHKFEGENDLVKDILELLQRTFGKVFVKLGNHDERREKKIHELAAQFDNLKGLEKYEDCFMFDRSTVEFIESYRIIKFGKLFGMHGHEYQGGGGIHVAYNRGGKAMDNLLSAHSHIAQTNIRKRIDGSVVISATLGCLCILNAAYNPLNNWTRGFAVAERFEDGRFRLDNRIIIDSESYPV